MFLYVCFYTYVLLCSRSDADMEDPCQLINQLVKGRKIHWSSDSGEATEDYDTPGTSSKQVRTVSTLTPELATRAGTIRSAADTIRTRYGPCRYDTHSIR